MKKVLVNLKNIVAGAVIGAVVLGGVVTASSTVADVFFNKYPVYSNGSLYQPKMPLLNYQGRTYVPLEEFSKLTGASVNFVNNAVYVNSNTNSYYDSNYNYFTYSNYLDYSDIEIDVDDTESFYVDLEGRNASSARLSYSGSYISLSQSYLTYSGKVNVTGKKEGKTTIKISYNTGAVDYIDVTVYDNDNYDYDDIELKVGETNSFYVDLDEYDAGKATLIYDDDCIKLSKTTFRSSGKVTITAEEAGESEIAIKYDTGDIDYVYVVVEDEDDYYDEDEDVSVVSVGKLDSISFCIDLDFFDANKATLTYDDEYVKLSKTTFTSSGRVTITGKKEGKTRIKVKYDTGDIEYIEVKIK